MAKDKWMQAARTKMEEKGTVGSFTRAAKKAGMSTARYQQKVLSSKSHASTKMKRKAAFRKAAMKANHG